MAASSTGRRLVPVKPSAAEWNVGFLHGVTLFAPCRELVPDDAHAAAA